MRPSTTAGQLGIPATAGPRTTTSPRTRPQPPSPRQPGNRAGSTSRQLGSPATRPPGITTPHASRYTGDLSYGRPDATTPRRPALWTTGHPEDRATRRLRNRTYRHLRLLCIWRPGDLGDPTSRHLCCWTTGGLDIPMSGQPDLPGTRHLGHSTPEDPRHPTSGQLGNPTPWTATNTQKIRRSRVRQRGRGATFAPSAGPRPGARPRAPTDGPQRRSASGAPPSTGPAPRRACI